MKIPFAGRILILGCGSVSQCLQPLLLSQMEMDFRKLTVMDFADRRSTVPETVAAGAQYVQERVTRDNLATALGRYVGPGDLLIDLAWNIGCIDIVQWCNDHQVLYINTSVELWDPYDGAEHRPLAERTLYVRHMALRQAARERQWHTTSVVEHGANPGLVSHWTKVALRDIAAAMLLTNLDQPRRAALEQALSQANYARVAMLTGTKTIHIAERDTQISRQPKAVGEFVNTWSIEGFREEGIAPAELGWGTHEKRLPPGANVHNYGPGNQIYLAQMGINTFLRSWVPKHGEIIGMLVRHGEAFTISDHLTVWDEQTGRPLYRPTVHYAYLPTDSALASLHEFKMGGYVLQAQQRIMTEEIVSGMDELGVLVLGHALNGWWTGSQLDIHEARRLAPRQNATTLQVAASVLGALAWIIRHPHQGLCVPDDLPPDEVLQVANPYLGPCPSTQTDWTPLQQRYDPFSEYRAQGQRDAGDLWQFANFVVS